MAIKTLGVLLFPRFELIDVCGPLEMFGNLPDQFKIVLIAEKSGPIQSAQNVPLIAEVDFENTPPLDLLLIPGGSGTRQEIFNKKMLEWIQLQSEKTEMLLSVCTGSALLAKAGLLDDRVATTNKLAFHWVKEQGPKVKWVEKARWVDDGNIITSSGVAAGIDMSLYVIGKMHGMEMSDELANYAEYVWNRDASNDLFAKNIKK